jgi:hypothetical protein
MGSTLANDLATMPELDLESAIGYHLQGNHYPPVPLSMVQPCIDAIDAYWEMDMDRNIELPDGVLWRGETYAPAYAIIESHHLEAWCSEDEYLNEVDPEDY